MCSQELVSIKYSICEKCCVKPFVAPESCVKSSKLPQVTLFEIALDEAEDFKFEN